MVTIWPWFNRSFGITMKHLTKQNSFLCNLHGKIGIQINNNIYTSTEKNRNFFLINPSATKQKLSTPTNVYYMDNNTLSKQEKMGFFDIIFYYTFWNLYNLYITFIKPFLRNTLYKLGKEKKSYQKNRTAWSFVGNSRA